MANRKQRRRREKEKRHDYEIVEIDGEGNETVLRRSELRPETDRGGKRNGRGHGAGRGKAKSPSGRDRGGRSVVQEPSWGRVIRRGAMFAPVFFVIVYLLAGDGMTISGMVIQTLILLLVFVPFSYLMDRFVWRTHQRRLAKQRDRP